MPEFKKILVPVRLHAVARTVSHIARAAELARKFAPEIVFRNVIDVDLDSSMPQRCRKARSSCARSARSARSAREDMRKALARTDLEGLKHEVPALDGRSCSEELQAADDLGAALIFVTARKPGMKAFPLCMTSARVARHVDRSEPELRDRHRDDGDRDDAQSSRPPPGAVIGTAAATRSRRARPAVGRRHVCGSEMRNASDNS